MTMAELLAEVDSAEDLFVRLGVDYDPEVLAVHRLHVLKRFGEALRDIEALDPAPDERRRRSLASAALTSAHEQFASPAPPRAENVFRGVRRGLVELRRHR